jgi:hypothetical protein
MNRRDPVTGIRPTKGAKGMTDTLERQRKMGKWRGKYKTTATAALAVRGTLDPLGTSMRAVAKSKCPCCNGTGRGKYELTDVGKRQLMKLRRTRGGA